jgi:hypothetical protein
MLSERALPRLSCVRSTVLRQFVSAVVVELCKVHLHPFPRHLQAVVVLWRSTGARDSERENERRRLWPAATQSEAHSSYRQPHKGTNVQQTRALVHKIHR